MPLTQAAPSLRPAASKPQQRLLPPVARFASPLPSRQPVNGGSPTNARAISRQTAPVSPPQGAAKLPARPLYGTRNGGFRA